jgi:hypothetical protein
MLQRLAGKWIREAGDKFEFWRRVKNSRKEAIALTAEVRKIKGSTVVGLGELIEIKKYCKVRFGDSSYWPWIVLYSEIRGEFNEGWIPDDFYREILADRLNKPAIPRLSMLKSFDHRLFPGFTVKPLLIRVNGIYFDQNHSEVCRDEAANLLQSFDGEVAVKRDSGPSGKGILFLQAASLDLENDLHPEYDYVVQPVVKQHPKISKVFPHSVNTLRVVTLLMPDGDIKAILTIMQFGRGKSRIDNVMAGGCFVQIHKDGVASSIGYDRLGLPSGEVHPDTGVRFSDLSIPAFDKAVESCINAHDLFCYNRLIAWDVCIDETGLPKSLDWNITPEVWRYEALFGPLWPDDVFSSLKIA